MSFTFWERNWNSESKPDPFLGVSQSILEAPFLQAIGGTRLRGIFFHRPDPNVTGRCIWSWAGPRPRQNWGSLGRPGWLGTITLKTEPTWFLGRLVLPDAHLGGYVFFSNKNGWTPWGAPHPPLWAYRPEAANRISQLKNWLWSNDQRINPPRPAEEGSSFQTNDASIKCVSSGSVKIWTSKKPHWIHTWNSDPFRAPRSPALQHSIEIPLFLRLLLRSIDGFLQLRDPPKKFTTNSHLRWP